MHVVWTNDLVKCVDCAPLLLSYGTDDTSVQVLWILPSSPASPPCLCLSSCPTGCDRVLPCSHRQVHVCPLRADSLVFESTGKSRGSSDSSLSDSLTFCRILLPQGPASVSLGGRVVFVGTYANSVFAIDAACGDILQVFRAGDAVKVDDCVDLCWAVMRMAGRGEGRQSVRNVFLRFT